jgi:hypothetical protein
MDPIDTIISSFDSLELIDSNEVARQANVHRTTVSRRVKGKTRSRADYREQCQLLLYEQERQLLQYIDTLTKRGLPPNQQNIRVFAQSICGKWPGENWVLRFVQRHSTVITSGYLTGFDILQKKANN